MVTNARGRNPAPRRLRAVVAPRFNQQVIFARDVFGPHSLVLDAVMQPQAGRRPQGLFFVDTGIACADRLIAIEGHARRLWRARAATGVLHKVRGGEGAKNDPRVLHRILKAIARAGLCRHSFVVAVGGGAVLDVVSYAAAVAHRGIRCIRVPTTTLSQADSGVGVKCAINALGRKNFLGVFAPPRAVINDSDFLKTLSPRDWRSGFSEIVKVALLKDEALLGALERAAPRIEKRATSEVEPLIHRSAELHFRHITQGGDPFEQGTARPLDFGHWAAHKLESMSGYRLRHGEAVAVGMLIDCVYCWLVDAMPGADLRRVITLLAALGFKLPTGLLSRSRVLLGGLEEFREHLGGDLQITLLRGIARPFESRGVDRSRMARAIAYVAGGWQTLRTLPGENEISRRPGRA